MQGIIFVPVCCTNAGLRQGLQRGVCMVLTQHLCLKPFLFQTDDMFCAFATTIRSACHMAGTVPLRTILGLSLVLLFVSQIAHSGSAAKAEADCEVAKEVWEAIVWFSRWSCNIRIVILFGFYTSPGQSQCLGVACWKFYIVVSGSVSTVSESGWSLTTSVLLAVLSPFCHLSFTCTQGIELTNPLLQAQQEDAQRSGTESYFSEYSGFRSIKGK